MVQTRNSDNNNLPNLIATQLAVIAMKLEAIETMKEDIAALKEGDRSRSIGSKNFNGEVLGGVDSLTFWEELVQAFTNNFGPAEFQNPDKFLCCIKQTGAV
ncbi:hypothetical protein Tco_0036894 [Tanacetum coccineum]